MVDQISDESGFAERLQKARVGVVGLAIYFALVGVIIFVGWLIGEVLNPLTSIIGFAAAVVMIAAVLPMIKLPLDGGWVDTIYYSAAICATLVIFIANGNERLANQIGLEIEEKELSLEEARFGLSRIASSQELSEGQLVGNRAELTDLNVALNSPEAVEFLGTEAELSATMIKSFGLDRLIVFLPQRLSRCVASRENLSSLNVQALQLEMEQNFSIQPRLGTVARGRELNVRDAMIQGMIQGAVEDVAICERFQRPAEQLLTAPNSYARLLGLLAISELIDLPWVGSDSEQQSTTVLTQIEEFEETRQRRDVLTRSVDGMEKMVSEGRAALIASNVEITARASELETLEKELAETKASRLVGSIAHAKDWGDRIWPFLLITLLGMKLARKPMLAFSLR